MRNGSMQAGEMIDEPLDLDKHRGMDAQKATDLRRVVAEVEGQNARGATNRGPPSWDAIRARTTNRSS
jgi:hypothetical protein